LFRVSVPFTHRHPDVAAALHQLELRAHLDPSLQAAGNRAEPGVKAVHALGLLPPLFRDAKAVVDRDSLDHQNVVLGFDLTDRLDLEAVPLDFDLTRFQRTGEGAGQSAAGRGYHVVERRRVRREPVRRDVIMLGDLRVDPEHNRFLLGG
jgi:hypothetical protein